ncbi:MAG: hypothetical protein DRJ35_03795 [Thermoprotei archaeon]|nr:MAG: hypothetical protein DRJ35_03795 [Thermoprotei archaeon]
MDRGKILKTIAKIPLTILDKAGSPKVVIATILILAFLITLLARLAPMKWGIYLNEFDPYYEFYLAEQILDHGDGNVLKGILWWYHWWFEDPKPKDLLFWYPGGRDLRRTSQPGAAFFSSTLYVIFSSLGVDTSLYVVHAFIPPVGAAFAVFAAYLLGKELRDESVGVLASVLISVSWAFMYRTNFGAKHEGLAIPFMLFAMYFFIKAYRENSTLNALIAGIFLGLVVLSWGAYLYPWNFIALVTLVWLLFHPDDAKLAKAFLIADIIMTLFIATLPRAGPGVAFISLAAIVPDTALVASIMTLTGTLSPSMKKSNLKKSLPYLAGGIILVLIVLGVTGVLAKLPGRILAVVLPLIRETGVTTVAEHAIPTWASIFQDYQSALLFGIFAAYIYFVEFKRNFEKLFVALFFTTALYFASTMVRLTLILSPATAIAASIGFVEIIDRLMELLSWEPRKVSRRSYSKEIVVVALVILILGFSPAILATKVPVNSHQPPLILSSSIPVVRYDYEYLDWISALEWIQQNVPEDSVIATWWDYGYWISVNTRRKTTCDNATLNTKQIQKIARALMSDEEEAVRIFKELGVDYVVVYEPLQKLTLQTGMEVYFSILHPAFGGDIAKSAQMLRWIGWSPSQYLYGYGNGTYAYIEQGNFRVYVLVPANNPKALNATLYKMVYTKNYKQSLFIFEKFMGQKLPGYNGPIYEIQPLKHFELVYVSEPNGWVKVFKVKYP